MIPEDRLRALKDPERWQGVRVPRVPAPAPTPRRGWVPLVAAFAIAVVVAAGLYAGLSHLRTAPPASPSPSITLRSADCTTALDPATQDAKRAAGLEPSGPEYAEKVAADTTSAVRRFLADGGTVCRWAPAGGDAAVVFAWSRIAAEDSEREAARLGRQGATRVAGSPYERLGLASGAGGWAFGDGWWAYAADDGGQFDVLDQVVRNTTGLAVPATCRGADLGATATPMGGALGTNYGDIVLVNRGSAGCTLAGYPVSRLVTKEGGAAVGAAPQTSPWTGGQGRAALGPVTLAAHGGKAYLRVSVVNIADYEAADGTDGKACGKAVDGRGWRITVPDTVDQVFVPFPTDTIPLCSNPDTPIAGISQVLRSPTTKNP